MRSASAIGINLGEILFDADEVSGDSVNIAARIEALAPPGSVCAQQARYRSDTQQSGGGLRVSRGPKTLKNIAEPVDVFPAARVTRGPATMTAGYRRRTDAGEAPRDLSAVVLPFKFQGDESGELARFGHERGHHDEPLALPESFVIARASAFVFREREASPQEIARELGVRYVINGSVQKAARRIRVSVQLTDAIRDRIVWGEHYSREFDDIFDIQDEITQVVVAATAVQIESSERERLRTLPPSDLRAYGYVLQGQQRIFQHRREENRAARQRMKPRCSWILSTPARSAAKSRTISLDWRYGWAGHADVALDEALALAMQATELDATDARGFGELGYVHLYRREHERGDQRLQACDPATNPNDADLMSDMADAACPVRAVLKRP